MTLSPAEESLRGLLTAHGLLIAGREGACTGAPGLCLLSVARGGARDEARGTLLHEAMHGLFYAHAPFAAHCWRFWTEQLSAAQRETWVAFLASLGYDVGNEELVVNEFQAYMCTERTLFGGTARRRESGLADAERLAATQHAFAGFIAPLVPQPPPRLLGCVCVFDGPFRMR